MGKFLISSIATSFLSHRAYHMFPLGMPRLIMNWSRSNSRLKIHITKLAPEWPLVAPSRRLNHQPWTIAMESTPSNNLSRRVPPRPADSTCHHRNRTRSNRRAWVWAAHRTPCNHRNKGRHSPAWLRFRGVRNAARWGLMLLRSSPSASPKYMP